MIVKNSLPSCLIALLAVFRIPSQLRSSLQPKKGFIQPAGMLRAIMSGETLTSAMTPIVSAEIVRIANWVTSVMTTLTIPPLMAYRDVRPRRTMA